MLQITECKILPDYCKLTDLQRFYTSMKIFYTSKKCRFVNFLWSPQKYIILFGKFVSYS